MNICCSLYFPERCTDSRGDLELQGHHGDGSAAFADLYGSPGGGDISREREEQPPRQVHTMPYAGQNGRSGEIIAVSENSAGLLQHVTPYGVFRMGDHHPRPYPYRHLPFIHQPVHKQLVIPMRYTETTDLSGGIFQIDLQVVHFSLPPFSVTGLPQPHRIIEGWFKGGGLVPCPQKDPLLPFLIHGKQHGRDIADARRQLQIKNPLWRLIPDPRQRPREVQCHLKVIADPLHRLGGVQRQKIDIAGARRQIRGIFRPAESRQDENQEQKRCNQPSREQTKTVTRSGPSRPLTAPGTRDAHQESEK